MWTVRYPSSREVDKGLDDDVEGRTIRCASPDKSSSILATQPPTVWDEPSRVRTLEGDDDEGSERRQCAAER